MIDKIDGLLFPHRFEPFPGVRDASSFEREWQADRAWVLANMAHLAYHSGPMIDALMRNLGAREVWTYNRQGAQAFLASWADKAILAFCGTQAHKPVNWENRLLGKLRKFIEGRLGVELRDEFLDVLANDVLADIKFRKVTEGAARVHRGFLGELNKLWRFEDSPGAFEGIAGDLASISQPTWVTGHSLGGAMAVLAATRYRFEETVTFGEPRVGTDIASMFKGGQHTRFVNGDDPVAELPPRIPGWFLHFFPVDLAVRRFGYEHHGTAKRLRESDSNVLFDHSILVYAENLRRRRGAA